MAGSSVTDLLVLGGAAIALVYAMKTGLLDQVLGGDSGGGGGGGPNDDDAEDLPLPNGDEATPPPSTTPPTTSTSNNSIMSQLQNNPAAMEAFMKLSPAEQAEAQKMFAAMNPGAGAIPPGSIPPVWPTYGNQLTGGPTLAPYPYSGYPPGYGPYGGPYPGGIPPQQAHYPGAGPSQTPGAVYQQPPNPGQSYPFTGYPRSTMSPAGNPAQPGLLSSLLKQNIPPMPSYATNPVGTYSPYSPYNQFYQYYQYSTNPTIYRDTKPDDNLAYTDIDKSKYYYDTILGSGATTSCVHCYNTCKQNPAGYGCRNCRPKCKVEEIRTLSQGGMGWNIGPANVVGTFFTDIWETLTKGGLHDSEHYDRDREFDCHNKRIVKPGHTERQRERREEQFRHSKFIDEDDYQFDRNDIQIALQ